MPRKKHSVEQVIHKLREAEVLLSQGKAVAEVCRALGVTEQTYYRWRKEYGGLRMEQGQVLPLWKCIMDTVWAQCKDPCGQARVRTACN